jgi:hypothetical protein
MAVLVEIERVARVCAVEDDVHVGITSWGGGARGVAERKDEGVPALRIRGVAGLEIELRRVARRSEERKQ